MIFRESSHIVGVQLRDLFPHWRDSLFIRKIRMKLLPCLLRASESEFDIFLASVSFQSFLSSYFSFCLRAKKQEEEDES